MTTRLSISRLVVLFSLWGVGSGCFRRVPSEPLPGPNQAEDYALTFYNNGFSFCDAQVLAWYIGASHGVEEPTPYEAKLRFGGKLANGMDPSQLDKLYLSPARDAAKLNGVVVCDYYASEFNYGNAEVLAQYWGVSVDEAKILIGEVLTWDGADEVYEILKVADNQHYVRESDQTFTALDVFWSSPLTSCDAELVASFWGMDFYDTKVALGQKVMMGMQRSDIEASVLASARENARSTGQSCEFWGSDLSLDEVEQLSCFFGLGLGETKTKIAGYAFEGRVSELRALLPEAATCTR